MPWLRNLTRYLPSPFVGERRMSHLTIDSMSDILLPITKTISMLVEQLDNLVSANCQSTNISEEAAELLADAGQTALRQSRALMHELAERRREGRGARPLGSALEGDQIS